jgi:predicted RNA-binding protein YlxR (DUF448 family)
VVCRARRSDTEMVRAGRDDRGRWYQGRGVGRGVWWCDLESCEAQLGPLHLARSLRTTVLESDVVALRDLRIEKRPQL